MLYLISSLHLGSYLLCLVHNRGGGRRKAIAKYVCNLCRRVLCSCRGRRVSLISYFIVCWVLWSHAVCSFSKQYFSICLSSSCYFLFPNWLKVFVCNLLINCLCLTPSGASLPVLYVSPDQLFLLLSCDPQWAVIIPVLEPMAAWRAVQCPVTCNPTPAPIHVGFILVQSWMWYSCTDSPALPALSLCSWCVLDSLTVPVVDFLRSEGWCGLEWLGCVTFELGLFRPVVLPLHLPLCCVIVLAQWRFCSLGQSQRKQMEQPLVSGELPVKSVSWI